MQILKISILLLSITMMLNGCRHKCQDPTNMDCENYNPCTAMKPTSADFEMSEDWALAPSLIPDNWVYYDSDTLCTEFPRFTLKNNTVDSVLWLIGAGVYHTKQLNIRFKPSYFFSTIPITCIAYKKAHRNCFPDDDGVDTFKRNLVLMPDTMSLCYGWFKGKNSLYAGDTSTVGMLYNQGSLKSDDKMFNLLRGYDGYSVSSFIGYRQFSFGVIGVSPQNYHSSGLMKIDNNDNNKININFSYADSLSHIPGVSIYNNTFIGFRK